MDKYLRGSILILIALILIYFFKDNISIISIATSIIGGVILFVFLEIENPFKKRPYMNNKNIGKRIRVSFAYLIRIKIDGKYLLVKGKFKKFQPVGGVYHYYDSILEHKFDFQRDDNHANEKDIRGTIPSNKKDKFIKWFNKRVNRECSINREYNEELLLTEILPKDLFENPEYKFICTKYKGIEWSEHYNIYELLRFDIYEIILNKNKKEFLRKMKKSNRNYMLATSDEIKKLGISDKSPVALMTNHTKYIL